MKQLPSHYENCPIGLGAYFAYQVVFWTTAFGAYASL
jgi:hypothetical protein